MWCYLKKWHGSNGFKLNQEKSFHLFVLRLNIQWIRLNITRIQKVYHLCHTYLQEEGMFFWTLYYFTIILITGINFFNLLPLYFFYHEFYHSTSYELESPHVTKQTAQRRERRELNLFFTFLQTFGNIISIKWIDICCPHDLEFFINAYQAILTISHLQLEGPSDLNNCLLGLDMCMSKL